MNRDGSMLASLRRVLESAAQGSGIARPAVEELKGTDRTGREAARLLLLGVPIAAAMRPLVEEEGEEVSMLASLIVAAPGSSAPLVGKSGGAVAHTLERWVKAKEGRALEQRVMRFRSLVTSAVLGAVTAMVATLGPLVGSIGFGGPGAGAGALVYGAAAMTAVSSGMLGVFMSGKRFYFNAALSMAAFAIVWAVASPLASSASAGLWGVK